MECGSYGHICQVTIQLTQSKAPVIVVQYTEAFLCTDALLVFYTETSWEVGLGLHWQISHLAWSPSRGHTRDLCYPWQYVLQGKVVGWKGVWGVNPEWLGHIGWGPFWPGRGVHVGWWRLWLEGCLNGASPFNCTLHLCWDLRKEWRLRWSGG